jgi:hypothetical protein
MSRARSANTKYRGPEPPFFAVTMISAAATTRTEVADLIARVSFYLLPVRPSAASILGLS